MVQDTVSDLITRIRNASLRHAESVRIPKTRFGQAILDALIRSGHLGPYADEVDAHQRPYLRVALRYVNGLNAIQALRQRSRQGLRQYRSYRLLRSPRRGGGFSILSTPLGVLTDREARLKRVGGELLAEIHSSGGR
jgi:small subunit ribosomal protein S8